MSEPVLFGIMPYLKSSEAISIRGIDFWPSQDIASNDCVLENFKIHLRELLSMFYVRNDTPIKEAVFTCFSIDSKADASRLLERLNEARTLIAYLYSSPHFPGGDPFLSFEHADLYLFQPDAVSRFLVGLQDEEEIEQDLKESQEPHKYDLEGYQGSLNQLLSLWVAPGSRIYPSLPHFWLNKSQDLAFDYRSLRHRDHHWPLYRFMSAHEPIQHESEQRIFTALEWYNRSCSKRVSEEVAVVHLATAFESLFGLDQATGLTERLKDIILSLLGKTTLLSSWIEQFYKARSKILHEGSWSHLAFYSVDSKTYGDILKDKQSGVIYRSLNAYGRQIFRLCTNALLTGNMLADKLKLHSTFIHNQDRLESICKRLANTDLSPEQRLKDVLHDVFDLNEYWLESDRLTRIETVIGAGRCILKVYLDTNPGLPSDIASLIQDLIQDDSGRSDTDQIRLFEHLNERIRNWQADESFPVTTNRSDLFNVFRAYIKFASRPGMALKTLGYSL